MVPRWQVKMSTPASRFAQSRHPIVCPISSARVFELPISFPIFKCPLLPTTLSRDAILMLMCSWLTQTIWHVQGQGPEFRFLHVLMMTTSRQPRASWGDSTNTTGAPFPGPLRRCYPTLGMGTHSFN